MPHDGNIESIGGRIELRGGAFAAVSVVALVLLLWMAAFLAGLAPWLGRMDKSFRNVSAGQVTIVGQASSGLSFGPTTFLSLAGQEVFVEYDVELRRGALNISILDYSGFEHVLWETVTSSGAGAVSLQVPDTGLYGLVIEPTVVGGAGQGYDLDVSAIWGARWP